MDEPAIAVRPAAAEAFDHEDFSALVSELFERTELPTHEIEIRLGYLWGDAAPPGWTWIEVVLSEAGDAVLDAVAAAIVV